MKTIRRFFFRGEAVGVAGHIRRPVDLVIPAQASVSLPIIGGRGVSAVNGGCFGDILSFGTAVVTVYGDYDPRERAVEYTQGDRERNRLASKTKVTTEVRDLSIVNSNGRTGRHTLTVARLATTLESFHTRQRGVEPSFATKLEIEGFAVDGVGINVEFADELLAVETYSGLYAPKSTGSKNVNAPRTRFADLFEPRNDPRTPEKAALPPDYEVCTACRRIQPGKKSPAEFVAPNRIKVKGFGTIYLAEMVLSPVDRRLALMRIELGSLVGGDVLIGGSGLDGHDWPP